MVSSPLFLCAQMSRRAVESVELQAKFLAEQEAISGSETSESDSDGGLNNQEGADRLRHLFVVGLSHKQRLEKKQSFRNSMKQKKRAAAGIWFSDDDSLRTESTTGSTSEKGTKTRGKSLSLLDALKNLKEGVNSLHKWLQKHFELVGSPQQVWKDYNG